MLGLDRRVDSAVERDAAQADCEDIVFIRPRDGFIDITLTLLSSGYDGRPKGERKGPLVGDVQVAEHPATRAGT